MFLCGACNWLNWHYFSVGSDCQSWFVQKEASRHTDRMVYDYGQYRKKNCVRLRRTFNGSHPSSEIITSFMYIYVNGTRYNFTCRFLNFFRF